MAGSRKNFVYTDGRNNQWYFQADESNIENMVIDDGSVDLTPALAATVRYGIPPNVRRATAIYEDPTTKETRTITVPNALIYEDLSTAGGALANTSFTGIGGQNFVLVDLIPERIQLPRAVDTAQLDGDED